MTQRILIVDGHSMIFRWPDLAKLHASKTSLAREELVRRLTSLQDGSNWTVVVVFDGKGVVPSHQNEPAGIHVFYSKSGQTADSIIERLSAKYAQTYDVTVATDDRLERITTESFGSSTISSEQLLAEIRAAESAVREAIRRLKR